MMLAIYVGAHGAPYAVLLTTLLIDTIRTGIGAMW